MADDTVQGILEGLKIAESRRTAHLQAQVERERIAAENMERMERIKIEQDRLRQQQKEFDVTQKAAKAINDLTILQKQLEIAEKQGAPGAARISPIVGQRADEQGNNYLTLKLGEDEKGNPITVDIADPRTAAKQVAEYERTVQRPKIEGQKEVDAAQAAATGEQQRLNIGASGEQARMTDASNFPREQWLTEFREANANYRARLAADTNLSEAMLRMRMESAVDTDALMSYYQGMADGTYNQDDIRKMLTPKQAVQLFGVAAKTKVVPLKKEQTAALGDIPMLLQTIRLVDQFIAKQPDVGENVASVKGAGAWNVLTNVPLRGLESQVKSQALIAAQILAKQPGRALSDQDRRAFDQGQLPRIMDSKVNNIKRRDDMMRAIRNMFTAVTYNLSDEQKKLVMENFNLTDIVTGPKQSEIKILKVEPAQ